MKAMMRVLLVTIGAGALAGCYVDGPGYAGGRPGYGSGAYVEGHFGPNGFWIPGHYRR